MSDLASLAADKTVDETVAAAARVLATAGVPEPRRDAGVLLGHALGAGRVLLLAWPKRRLNAIEAELYRDLVRRRARREPVSRLVGRREFWSMDFVVTPAVLDPRPDSETVVEAVLERVADRAAPLSVLDLGTGSGCLLMALLAELPNAVGVGVDLSRGALDAARDNARRLGFRDRARFLHGDWGRGLAGGFNVIVTNPPYIPDGEIEDLAPEVAGHEPRLALSGGVDGLEAYRRMAPDLAGLLAPNGFAVLEVGAGQADDVAAILGRSGLAVSGRRADLAGIERCLVAEPARICPGGKKGLESSGRTINF